jgi:hypothetical protein
VPALVAPVLLAHRRRRRTPFAEHPPQGSDGAIAARWVERDHGSGGGHGVIQGV